MLTLSRFGIFGLARIERVVHDLLRLAKVSAAAPVNDLLLELVVRSR